MPGHLARILEAMLEHAESTVGLPADAHAGRAGQFARWNETQRNFPANACIHDLVAIGGESTPERTAVTFGKSSLTYRELNVRANKLARHLQARGVKAGDLVGLCVERSCEMIVAMLGILKAGAAYVPLDPAYPRERIAHMIKDSGAALIITQQSLAGGLPARDAAVLCIDRRLAGNRAGTRRGLGASGCRRRAWPM